MLVMSHGVHTASRPRTIRGVVPERSIASPHTQITVHESLVFSARLRHSRGIAADVIHAFIQEASSAWPDNSLTLTLTAVSSWYRCKTAIDLALDRTCVQGCGSLHEQRSCHGPQTACRSWSLSSSCR